MKTASPELLKAIAVTAELTGTAFSDPAARVMASDLAQFPEHQVMQALQRCRRELRSTLTLAAILERIDDGRPGPDEAWALVSQALGNESATVCWTGEMAAAFWIAGALSDDPVAARMAFLERYRKDVAHARAEFKPVAWSLSLGTDAQQREKVILQAVEQGKIGHDHAMTLLPHIGAPDARIGQLVEKSVNLIGQN